MNLKTYAEPEFGRVSREYVDIIEECKDECKPVISVPTYDPPNPMSDEVRQAWHAVLLGFGAACERIPVAVNMLTPTVSDVMDRVTNLTLRGQIFKIVGLHAPNYTEVADLGQKWMDAIGNLLKVSNGSTFYVSGRTQAADGTMYYAPTHQATSFLLMVAAEKGDACKSKGVYNAESDIGEVLTLMHRLGGFQNPAYTVFYDAEHVYPGVVP